MALAKLNESPSYVMTMPSTGKEVHYRPYLVKEEKILLMAIESKDEKQAMRAMADTITACVQEEIPPRSLTTFDVEHMFTKIRTKSVGETAVVGIKCGECGESNDVEVDLDSVKLSEHDESPMIELTDRISIEMKHPSFLEMSEFAGREGASEHEYVFQTIVKCVAAIVDGDERTAAEDVPPSELSEFIESFTSMQFKKVAEWVNNTPRLKHSVEFTCGKCGHENTRVLEGFQSFF